MASSTSFSGVSFSREPRDRLGPRVRVGPPNPPRPPGEDGRKRGEPVGLARPPGAFEPGVKLVKAKLKRAGPSPLLEVEPIEALLPWRLCSFPSGCSPGWGTRTIVSLLVEERDGFIFTAACAPHGSEAVMDPLRDESLLDRVGLCSGLCAGDASVLLRALEVMSGMMIDKISVCPRVGRVAHDA